VAYLPVSNLFSLNATVAEHWLYVPSAFLFLAAALTLSRSAVPRGVVIAAVGLWMVFLGARTFLRQADWRDRRTFIERTITQGGDSPRMHMNLGNLEAEEGRTDLALAQYREALQRAPEQATIWLAYANVLLRNRDFATAREALGRAETSPLLAAECRQTRAVLEHLETGRDTGDLLREAVELAPRNWSIRKRHLEHLIERGDRETALRELHNFMRTSSFRADSWRLMGQILESMKNPALALDAYRQAADRDVHDENARSHIRQLTGTLGNRE
jgi:Tfp pilus assembly protein PilF